jgi:hypothetical protein
MAKWEVTWTPVAGSLADSYNVYSRHAGDLDWVSEGSTTATRITLEIAASPRLREVGVSTVVAGLESPEDEWTTVSFTPSAVVDLTTPADVTNFNVGQSGGRVAFRWDAVNSDDLDEYEIRQGPGWNSATKVHTAPGSAHSALFSWASSGAKNYQIKAKSKGGVWSAAAAAASITIKGDDYYPIQTTNDESTPGFTGTKTGTAVDTGALVPEALPVAYSSWTNTYSTYTHPWWWPRIPEGTYVTATVDAGAVIDDLIEVDLAVGQGAGSTDYAEWKGQLYPELDDTADTEVVNNIDAVSVYEGVTSAEVLINSVDVKIEIDTAQDGVPTWDGYRIWVPGSVYTFRQVRLRFTFGMLWPWLFPKITGLTWYTRRQNRKGEGTATVSATGGTAVTWDTTFTAAPTVTVSVIGTTAVFATADTITVSGCNVRTWDADGVELDAGTVHVQAMGV